MVGGSAEEGAAAVEKEEEDNDDVRGIDARIGDAEEDEEEEEDNNNNDDRARYAGGFFVDGADEVEEDEEDIDDMQELFLANGSDDGPDLVDFNLVESQSAASVERLERAKPTPTSHRSIGTVEQP